ncbi:MAG: Rieske 2Fe-2S domain-containing protein [Alphaproteobacteria bacterium]|nr:Rieske 2Fe-2S domain-containing protein [Alphaproteobacteria bacterium]
MNREVQDGLKPGEARCFGPSVQDILERDGDAPAYLREQSYRYLGSDDLSADRYTSRAFHDLEMERMWSRVWQMACREEEIPEVGDNLVYEIGDHSLIVVRVGDDDIRAYHNSCLHRGTQLRPGGDQQGIPGTSSQFRCPFHGWTWNLDGSLKEIPCRWDFPHVDDAQFTLPQARVGRWGGFVFVNLDENAMSLEEYLGELPRHFENWRLEDRYMSANVRRILPCNWKVGQEAFIESYHVVETHIQAMPMTGDANTQYDIWGDRVSRLYTLNGVSSPHLEKPLSEEELADVLQVGVGTNPRDGALKLAEGETARSRFADALRQEAKARYGADLSALSISEMIDPIEYFLFPNLMPWFNYSLPLVYRFRPYGNDPDWCIMDVMLLHPVPDDGPRPEPAPLRILGPDDPFTDAPELDQISPVFEQDVSNMPRVQRGLKAARKGVTLGNYQEIRIRHMHRTLDAYLSRP